MTMENDEKSTIHCNLHFLLEKRDIHYDRLIDYVRLPNDLKN